MSDEPEAQSPFETPMHPFRGRTMLALVAGLIALIMPTPVQVMIAIGLLCWLVYEGKQAWQEGVKSVESATHPTDSIDRGGRDDGGLAGSGSGR